MTAPTQNERVIEKLDEIGTAVAVIKSQLPTITQVATDHEARLRSLEARLWYAMGAIGLLAFVVPLITSYFQ